MSQPTTLIFATASRFINHWVCWLCLHLETPNSRKVPKVIKSRFSNSWFPINLGLIFFIKISNDGFLNVHCKSKIWVFVTCFRSATDKNIKILFLVLKDLDNKNEIFTLPPRSVLPSRSLSNAFYLKNTTRFDNFCLRFMRWRSECAKMLVKCYWYWNI